MDTMGVSNYKKTDLKKYLSQIRQHWYQIGIKIFVFKIQLRICTKL